MYASIYCTSNKPRRPAISEALHVEHYSTGHDDEAIFGSDFITDKSSGPRISFKSQALAMLANGEHDASHLRYSLSFSYSKLYRRLPFLSHGTESDY